MIPITRTVPLRLNRFLWLALTLGALHQAHATGPLASGSFTDISLGGGTFDFTITLNDIGSTNIGTFWYSWIPGEDFMAVSPTNIVSPSGWTPNITHGGSSDGYAIQWVASTGALTPGNSGTFSFDSTSTPAQLNGNSTFYPTTPVGTSFVYSGGPFSDSGDQIVVSQAVPEPRTTASLVAAGAAGIAGLRRRVRRRPDPLLS